MVLGAGRWMFNPEVRWDSAIHDSTIHVSMIHAQPPICRAFPRSVKHPALHHPELSAIQPDEGFDAEFREIERLSNEVVAAAETGRCFVSERRHPGDEDDRGL